MLGSPVTVFHRFWIRPRTFLVVVKHNAMKKPVKQDFMVKISYQVKQMIFKLLYE